MFATPRSLMHRATTLSAAFLLASCGGGGGSIVNTTPGGGGGGGGGGGTGATVTSVTVAPGTASVTVGGTTTLSASVATSGGASTAVNWTSSNSGVASVSSNGSSATVTGVSVGSATVTATSQVDGSKSGSAVITVTSIPVASITISAPASSIRVNQTTQATAVARDASNNTVSGATFTWTITPAANASVNANGLVTGTAAGAVTLTARSGNVTSNALAITILPVVTVASWSAQSVVPSNFWKGAGTVFDFFSTGTPTVVYAVTTSGYIGRWDQNSWTNVDRASNGLIGIHGSGPTDIYAVGIGGLIRRFDGTSWSTMISPTTQSLYHAYIPTAQSGYAVGTGGAIVRLQGGTWSTQAVPGVASTLWGVHGSSANNIFAVGDGGVILQNTGSGWARVVTGLSTNLYGVWVFSSTFAVAVGNGGLVLRWNGSTWTTVAAGITETLFSVNGDPATGTIVAGGASGGVYTSSTANINSWTAANPSLVGDSNDAVWRNDNIGILAGFSQAGVLRRTTTGSWSVSTFAPTLNGIGVASATSAVAGGNYGSFAQLLGTAWNSGFAASGSYGYFGQTWAPTATTFLGVRYNGVYQLSSGIWNPVYTTNGLWNSIGGTSPTDGHAGGFSRELARYNGSTWSAVTPSPLLTGDVLLKMRGVAGGPVFAVGYDATGAGVIYRWSGTTWSKVATTSTGPLNGVAVSDANNAFAVGTSGTIMRWNGSTWITQTTTSSNTLRDVWMPSATEAYAVGDAGTILKYENGAWTAMNSGTNLNLQAIDGISGVLAVAVGDGMTVMMGGPTAATAALYSSRPHFPTFAPAAAPGDGPAQLRLPGLAAEVTRLGLSEIERRR